MVHRAPPQRPGPFQKLARRLPRGTAPAPGYLDRHTAAEPAAVPLGAASFVMGLHLKLFTTAIVRSASY